MQEQIQVEARPGAIPRARDTGLRAYKHMLYGGELGCVMLAN